MKVKTRIMTLLIAAVLAACAPVATTPPRSKNFTFVFQDFACGSIPMYVLDTTSNTLVYTPIGDTTSITIPLQLVENELDAVYQKAMSIGFFEYPSEFVVPEDQVLGYQAPSSSYQLSMTNGEMTNSVAWQDDTMTKPEYTKSDQLRELMNLIDEIIQSYPAVHQLPESKAQCA